MAYSYEWDHREKAWVIKDSIGNPNAIFMKEGHAELWRDIMNQRVAFVYTDLPKLTKSNGAESPIATDKTYDHYGETFYEYICPQCENFIDVSGLTQHRPTYCEHCGKKLDWGKLK